MLFASGINNAGEYEDHTLIYIQKRNISGLIDLDGS